MARSTIGTIGFLLLARIAAGADVINDDDKEHSLLVLLPERLEACVDTKCGLLTRVCEAGKIEVPGKGSVDAPTGTQVVIERGGLRVEKTGAAGVDVLNREKMPQTVVIRPRETRRQVVLRAHEELLDICYKCTVAIGPGEEEEELDGTAFVTIRNGKIAERGRIGYLPVPGNAGER